MMFLLEVDECRRTNGTFFHLDMSLSVSTSRTSTKRNRLAEKIFEFVLFGKFHRNDAKYFSRESHVAFIFFVVKMSYIFATLVAFEKPIDEDAIFSMRQLCASIKKIRAAFLVRRKFFSQKPQEKEI